MNAPQHIHISSISGFCRNNYKMRICKSHKLHIILSSNSFWDTNAFKERKWSLWKSIKKHQVLLHFNVLKAYQVSFSENKITLRTWSMTIKTKRSLRSPVTKVSSLSGTGSRYSTGLRHLHCTFQFCRINYGRKSWKRSPFFFFFPPKTKSKTDLNFFFGSSCRNMLPAGQSYMWDPRQEKIADRQFLWKTRH